MKTLKQLRLGLGLNQSEVAAKINVSIPKYSLYENSQAFPDVEDAIILERNFSQLINWKDSINDDDKKEIISSISILAEHYPISSVLSFSQRALHDGIRLGKPAKLFTFYSKIAQNKDIEPLIFSTLD